MNMYLLAQAIIKIAGKREEMLQRGFEVARQSMHVAKPEKKKAYEELAELAKKMKTTPETPPKK